MEYPIQFVAQNWAVSPVALALNELRPANISEQQWQITLSGIGIANLKGQKNDWRRETVIIYPDIRSPMNRIIQHFGIPVPTETPYDLGTGAVVSEIYPVFQINYMVPFVAISSVFDKNTAVNAGFAVDSWRPNQFITLTDFRPGGNAPTLRNIYSGIVADLAVSDIDASINRFSYHITLMGKIVFVRSIT